MMVINMIENYVGGVTRYTGHRVTRIETCLPQNVLGLFSFSNMILFLKAMYGHLLFFSMPNPFKTQGAKATIYIKCV